VVDKDKRRIKLLKGGVLSVINECSEILNWVRNCFQSFIKLYVLINY